MIKVAIGNVVVDADTEREPILDRVLSYVREHVKSNAPHLRAVEVKDFRDLLGGLGAIADAIGPFAGVLFVDGVEFREADSIKHGRFMPVFACRACSGRGCARCAQSGERKGRR